MTSKPNGHYEGQVTIPSKLTYDGEQYSVTGIGWCAFAHCNDLISISIPVGMTSIRENAFYECSNLTIIIFPKSIRNIYSGAFANCPELRDVHCYAETVPSTATSAFNGLYFQYATLHVPASVLENYKAKAPWSTSVIS